MNQATVHNPAEFQIALKILLKNKKGEYLILKSKGLKDVLFDLPGGRINTDEINTNFHLLIDREIKEEIGLNVKYNLRKDPVSLGKYSIPKKYPLRSPGSRERFFILFEADYIKGKITLSKEHIDFEWREITKKEINSSFPPIFKEVLNNYFDWNK